MGNHYPMSSQPQPQAGQPSVLKPVDMHVHVVGNGSGGSGCWLRLGATWWQKPLAAYMLRADTKQSLPDYLDARISKSIGKPIGPHPSDVQGFAEFFARHTQGLSIERAAVKALR